jgi:hypothetical protein
MVDPTPFRPRFLTMHALDNAETWEPALSLPLPDNPGFDLLQRTRDEVLSYLVWLFNDVARVPVLTMCAARSCARPTGWRKSRRTGPKLCRATHHAPGTPAPSETRLRQHVNTRRRHRPGRGGT